MEEVLFKSEDLKSENVLFAGLVVEFAPNDVFLFNFVSLEGELLIVSRNSCFLFYFFRFDSNIVGESSICFFIVGDGS